MIRPPPSSQRPRANWLIRSCCALAVLVAAIALASWMTLRASLPQLDGKHTAPTLSAAVTIERDALGVPTLHGSSRADIAYATGFVHAQDRFFQMDLLRRVATGEMSALLGPAALDLDRRNRSDRFRERAEIALNAMPAD